jgi:acetyl-CoA carboxylase carboxyltransferase component
MGRASLAVLQSRTISKVSWEPELDEIRRREALAREMGGAANIQRQHDAGRLTVRERIDRLLDSGSFHEIGTLAGRATYDAEGKLTAFTPSNFVVGTGRIDSRQVVVGGDDFTVRGGAADAKVGDKMGHGEKLARGLRIPIVRLVDGTGGGGSVKTIEQIGRTYVPANPAWDQITAMLGEVPVIGACLGPVAGLGAVRVVTSHFSLMVRGSSQLFVAGPPVVERGVGEKVSKEQLGGYEIHTRGSGAVDNEVASEDEAFQTIRRFLSYLPPSVWQAPPRAASPDAPSRRDEDLISIIPRDRRRTYDVRRILNAVVDRDSFFEIGCYYGRPLVTGLARLNGYPVGVMANDPRHGGGAPNAPACDKMIRLVDICDTFHLPVVNFVDNPGFMIGHGAESAGTLKQGVRAITAIYQARVPWATVVVRRVYGVAGAGHQDHSRYNYRITWPSGEWGSIPIEGGVMAAYRRQIEAADDPEAYRADLERRLVQMRSPFRTAESFNAEDIVDPRRTRPLLCRWVRLAYRALPPLVGPTARHMRP